MIQDALRLLAPADQPPTERIDVARRVMRHLPETAWLRMNGNVRDQSAGGDAGLYDLLLNPRDQAFTVLALHDLLAQAGLRPTCWVEPLRYDPAPLLPDPRLRERAAALPPLQRAALAESLAGNMSVHVVYCVRADRPEDRANPFDPASVPLFREVTGEVLANALRPDGTLMIGFDGLQLPIVLPPRAAAILRLVDGKRNVGAIAKASGMPSDVFESVWRATYLALERVNRLLMAAPPGVA